MGNYVGMWRLFVGAATCALLGGVLAACGSPAVHKTRTQLTNVSFQITGTPAGTDAPYEYGVAAGIYRKFGLNVTVTPGQGGSTQLATYIGDGKVEFGANVAASGVLANAAAGLDLVVVFGTDQLSPAAVLVPKSSSITTLAGLKGKTVGVGLGTSTATLFPALLAANHIAAGSVQIEKVATSALPSLLIDGKVQAVLGFANGLALQLDQSGMPVRALAFGNYGVAVNGAGVATSAAFIKAHPEIVKELVAGTQAAFIATERHPTAAMRAVQAADGPGGPSIATLLSQWDVFQTEMRTPNDPKSRPLGWQSVKDWQKSEQLATEYLGLTKQVPVNTVFTNRFLPNG